MNNCIEFNHEETLLLLDGLLHEYHRGRRTLEMMGSEIDIQAWFEAVKDLYDRLAAGYGFQSFEARLGYANAAPIFEVQAATNRI